MFGTLATQLYIDSEQTIINDLKDTFSCKTSNESTNILKINTSTYSVARTANHISQRLEDACRRLESIETSVNKSKSRNKENKSNNRSQENTGGPFRKTGPKQQISQESNSYTKAESEIVIYANSQRDLMEIIKKLSAELKQSQAKVDQLDDKLTKKQRQLLMIEQKFLRQQKSLIIEINRLKSILKEKLDIETKYFNEKVELERIIDENKVKVWQLESQMKELIQKYSKWSEKEVVIAETVNKYQAKLQKQELSLKGLSKKSKEDQEILKILKIILEEEQQSRECDKENNQQLSNRGKWYSSVEKASSEEMESLTCRSYTQHHNSSKPMKNTKFRSLQKLTCLSEAEEINTDLYHCLMLQAASLQKLIM